MLRLLCSLWLAGALSAGAVVVSGGTNAQNTTAPANDFGFSRIAFVNNASAVYLGGGWLLSAWHVAGDGSLLGSVALGGAEYGLQPGSGVRLQNADGTAADLALFRLNTVSEGLAGAVVSTLPMTPGTAVIMAGYGLDRENTRTGWQVSAQQEWTEVSSGFTRRGYKLLDTHSLHWGTNETVLFDGLPSQPVNDGYGTTQMFATSFEQSFQDAQGVPGDSGGGVFRLVAGQYELCGVMLSISTFAGQPGATAVYGNRTLAADLSLYREQILAVVVPEPGGWVLAGLGAGVLLCAKRRPRIPGATFRRCSPPASPQCGPRGR